MAGLMPLLAVVVVVLGGLPCITAAVTANRFDAAAMRALANSTGAAASSLGWGVKSGDPCDGTWAGVTCDEVGRVTSIVASRAGLDGVLRGSDLANLTYLAELDLSFNRLTGLTDADLPLLPAPLQGLRRLDLRSNRFYSIPEGFFAGVPALETIALDDNPMVGAKFRLDARTCSRLRSLSANNIGVLGQPFPDFLGNTLVCPVLESLLLARNQMWGRIPASFGNNSKIKYLDISDQIDTYNNRPTLANRIDGFIPGMQSLVEVRMDRSGFYGPLPDATKLVNLRVFSAVDNDLCGVPKFADTVASVNLTGNRWVGLEC